LVIATVIGDGDVDLYINKGYNNLPDEDHYWKKASNYWSDEIFISNKDVKDIFNEYKT